MTLAITSSLSRVLPPSAGIMGLAATMKVLGLPLGIIVLLGMAFLTEISLEILVRTSTVQHVWSYSDLVRQEFGNIVRIVLDVSVVINNLGICCVYLIIVGQWPEALGPTINAGYWEWQAHLDVTAMNPLPHSAAAFCDSDCEARGSMTWRLFGKIRATSRPQAIQHACACGACCAVAADVLSGTGSHEGLLVAWNNGVATGWNSRYVVILFTIFIFLAPLACLKHVGTCHILNRSASYFHLLHMQAGCSSGLCLVHLWCWALQ